MRGGPTPSVLIRYWKIIQSLGRVLVDYRAALAAMAQQLITPGNNNFRIADRLPKPPDPDIIHKGFWGGEPPEKENVSTPPTYRAL